MSHCSPLLRTLSCFSETCWHESCFLLKLTACIVCVCVVIANNDTNREFKSQALCVASVEFLSTSVSTAAAPGGHRRVCFCGLGPAVGLCGRPRRADNSLRVATEGSLISQTQSQINGLVAEFRRSVFSDNQRQSRALLGESFF